MNKVLIICGPTATGKTAVAVKLAKKFNGELVSADSRQVYRGMNIGTGKDTMSLQGIPIWMYDVVNPDESFNVSQYQILAAQVIAGIMKRGKLPIIVGGTGLYIKSLISSFDGAGVGPDEALRKKLSTYSLSALQKMLQDVGKELWDVMNVSDRQNPRRLIRKIEIAHGTKQEQPVKKIPYDVCQIGLRMDSIALYKRIDERVMRRVEEGVEQEIRILLQKGYRWDLPSMSGLGYRQWKAYVDKTNTKEEVIERWKFDEHGYARRQMTWFRADKTIHWFDAAKRGIDKEIESAVTSWYTL
ncbi:MAG: tRNA (adenosine(37)-N6)-dimethylallyltransferase MiaA [Candidatus Gottesmanbacteria bacterium]